jgi:shikimate dehydrogenase
MRPITGTTRLYGILADPIYHVKTPQGGDEAAEILDTPQALDHRREPVRGDVERHQHAVTPDAHGVGAVNCVRRDPDGRMVGTILDGIGLVEALRASGAAPRCARRCG